MLTFFRHSEGKKTLPHLAVSSLSLSLIDKGTEKALYNIKIQRQFAPTGCLWKVLTTPVMLNIHQQSLFSPLSSFVSTDFRAYLPRRRP